MLANRRTRTGLKALTVLMYDTDQDLKQVSSEYIRIMREHDDAIAGDGKPPQLPPPPKQEVPPKQDDAKKPKTEQKPESSESKSE